MLNQMRSLLLALDASIEIRSDTHIRKLLQNLKILFLDRGMINSVIANRAINASNVGVPWYTYPSTDYLNQLDFSESRVIEFGSGSSTLYWAKSAKQVVSIERDREWYLDVSSNICLDNVDMLLLSDQKQCLDYVGSLPDNSCDILVIDGHDRYSTMMHAHSKLSDGGILIFDNSDWYPNSCKYLRSNGYSQIDFIGFGPINNYTWCTSIFFRSQIRIPHKNNIRFIGGREIIKPDDEGI